MHLYFRSFLEQGVIKEQVYHALRNAIVEGRLPPGTRYLNPGTVRDDVNLRNSVIAGYDRLLLDEGIFRRAKGAGTFVTPSLLTAASAVFILNYSKEMNCLLMGS